MKKNKDLVNLVVVICSNILIIIVNLFLGFALPNFMSVEDYAYYRVYCLYIGYVGIFHLGIVNGVYLLYGKYNFDQLPKQVLRRYTYILTGIQFAFVILLFGILAVFKSYIGNETCIAYAFIIINIPIINLKLFFSYINQFTKRFLQDSCIALLQSVVNLLIVVIVVSFNPYHFEYLLFLVTVNNLLCLLLAGYQNRKLIFGKSDNIDRNEFKEVLKSGFLVLISEFAGVIILGIDSIFVQHLFSVNDFAMYSFAVSVITAIYSLIATVSNLVYPYLARTDDSKHTRYYNLLTDVILIVSAFSMLGFFVSKYLVENWIDKYVASIPIIAILFGTVLFRSIIALVCANYFKVLKMVKEFTINNAIAIVITGVLDVVAYLIFKDYIYIAWASLLAFIIWFIISDVTFVLRLDIHKKDYIKRYVYIIAILSTFFVLNSKSSIVAFFIYFAIATVITFLLFFYEIKEIIKLVKRK